MVPTTHPDPKIGVSIILEIWGVKTCLSTLCLIWYSDKKLFSGRLSWCLASKIDSELRKCPMFVNSASAASNRLRICQKILWVCSLKYKNLLILICLTIKFQDRHDANVQCLAKQTDFWRFFIQNRVRREGRKLPKCYVKSTNFSSIARTNVGSFSMSFGCKISNGSRVMSRLIWNYEKKSILVWKFAFSNLMACNSTTT